MKQRFDAYRLSFHSGLHIGIREGSLEGTETIIHSDTLFSAFVNGYRLMYEGDKFDALVHQFESGNVPLRFSSAFPFEGSRLYLPVPQHQIPKDKQAKKVRFVELGAWQRLINGEKLEDLLTNSTDQVLPRPANANDPQKEATPWTVMNTPRVGLDRRTNHPGDRYFHCGETHFTMDSGLYFWADYDDDKIRDQAHAVWRLMADEGLGGDRTVGKGLFAYPQVTRVSLEIPDNAAGWVSLSLYYPAADELTGLTEGYYDLIQRRGYIYSMGGRTLRRCPVTMFAEGSVFPSVSKRSGRLVDTAPERFTSHPVYRSGLAFGVPCVLQEGSS
jgi:CRISPR-associated protein Csm4